MTRAESVTDQRRCTFGRAFYEVGKGRYPSQNPPSVGSSPTGVDRDALGRTACRSGASYGTDRVCVERAGLRADPDRQPVSPRGNPSAAPAAVLAMIVAGEGTACWFGIQPSVRAGHPSPSCRRSIKVSQRRNEICTAVLA